MALKDIGFVNSLDRKGQFTTNSRTRNKRRRTHNFFSFDYVSPITFKNGCPLGNFKYHNPLDKEKGVTIFFRSNATSVSLNVMIFKLFERGSTGLSKGLYITKINFDVVERKKK